MINSFSVPFDFTSFVKKLRHYFADTAPIQADVIVGLTEVKVSNGVSEISIRIDPLDNIKSSVRSVVNECEYFLYPRMVTYQPKEVQYSDEEITKFLIQGLSLEEIKKKQQVLSEVWYMIIRFNISDNTIVYKEFDTGRTFKVLFKYPLAVYKDKIIELSREGKKGSQELFRLIVGESSSDDV